MKIRITGLTSMLMDELATMFYDFHNDETNSYVHALRNLEITFSGDYREGFTAEFDCSSWRITCWEDETLSLQYKDEYSTLFDLCRGDFRTVEII